MPSKGISGIGLATLSVGGILTWAGIRGYSILKAVQNMIQGKPAATGQSVSSLTAHGVQTATGPGVAAPTSGTWTHDGLMKLWESVGGPAGTANNAACHAIQESSGNASVTSPNPDGGENVGLWQLDTKGKGAGYTVAQLQNPTINARVALIGSSNGSDWSAWATPGC
jgi:hypothetical protein